MADAYIQVPPQSTGLKLDTTELTVGANTVERERVNISDPTDAAGLAKVENTTPGASDYGVVTRPILSALPAGTNVIGHVIADTGSTTAVTGSVTVVQGTGTNLHTVVDSGTLTAVTAITNALPAGTNVIGHVITDTGSTTAVTGTVTTSDAADGSTGAAVPAKAIYTGFNSGGNLTGISSAAPLPTVQTGALPAGSNVIGHVIADTGSTTAVTGSVTVAQATGTNLHAVIDTGSTTAVTGNVTVVQTTGTNLHAVLDTTSTTAVTQATGTNLHAVIDSGTITTVSTVTAVTAITNALPAGTNTLGQVALVPVTTGGCSAAVGGSTPTQALTTTTNIKASAGQLYGYMIYNPNASAVFVEYYNTATTPGTIGSTTNLILEFAVPGTGAANVFFDGGIAFSSGIAVAVATTATGAVAPGTGLCITTIFK